MSSTSSYPELGRDMREVLRTLGFAERRSPPATGGWFIARIMPYRTLENKVDGVAITFVDITVSKTLEAELRKAQADLEKRMVAQGVKLDQAGERLQVEIRARPTREGRRSHSGIRRNSGDQP